jgi:hypothetical protein
MNGYWIKKKPVLLSNNKTVLHYERYRNNKKYLDNLSCKYIDENKIEYEYRVYKLQKTHISHKYIRIHLQTNIINKFSFYKIFNINNIDNCNEIINDINDINAY